MTSQSVDSQSTTDDETCSDGGLLCELQRDMERLVDNQQQLVQQHQRIRDIQQRRFQLVMDRLGNMLQNDIILNV